MALFLVLSLLCFSLPAFAQYARGIDISGYTENVDFESVKASGVVFVYIKATEGTSYTSDLFDSQYTGATDAGLIRGSYHFARPDRSTGAAQAEFFVSNGGGWTADGITLPGALDLETNPYGDDECYGLSASAMVSWIRDFSNTYLSQVGRYPVIYTTTSWWNSCTGDSTSSGSTNPLWIARWASTVGDLPSGWSTWTFWQNSDDASPNPGDSDYYNGDLAGLQTFATGS